MRNWTHKPYHPQLAQEIPPAPGVYVIASAKRSLGFASSLEALYVGQSRDLRRRYQEHTTHGRSHNHELSTLARMPSTEFWFHELSEARLDQVERQLIRALSPTLNAITYGTKQ